MAKDQWEDSSADSSQSQNDELVGRGNRSVDASQVRLRKHNYSVKRIDCSIEYIEAYLTVDRSMVTPFFLSFSFFSFLSGSVCFAYVFFPFFPTASFSLN